MAAVKVAARVSSVYGERVFVGRLSLGAAPQRHRPAIVIQISVRPHALFEDQTQRSCKTGLIKL